MTTTQPIISFPEIIIKKTSAYFQTQPLSFWAKKYKSSYFAGQLTRENAVADACNITVTSAKKFLSYCYPVELFFIELESLMAEENLLTKQSYGVALGRYEQQYSQSLSTREVFFYSNNYQNDKCLNELNNCLFKDSTEPNLDKGVSPICPASKTIQEDINLNHILIVKSAYELIFANILLYAGIRFFYDVNSGIQNDTKIFIINFEVFFNENSVFVELAHNLYVDESRCNNYAKNLPIKHGEYLHKLAHKNVHFIDTGKPYYAFYEDIVQWLNNYIPQADIATFDISMTEKISLKINNK